MGASGYARLDDSEIFRNIEARLGDTKVRRSTNKVLKKSAKELEPEFKDAISAYKDTGATVDSAVTGGVAGSGDGVPIVKLGFTSPRWQLVHLNELGYAKKPNPRGFGVIRKFAEAKRESFKNKVAQGIRQELF